MSGIGAIQALSPAEAWEAWQALLQASLNDGGAEQMAAPHGEIRIEPGADLHAQPLPATATTEAAAQAQQASDVPVAPPATAPHESRPAQSHATPAATQAQLQPTVAGLPADTPVAAARLTDGAAMVLPMAPVTMTPLTLQQGPELRWRVQDAAAWRTLFDDAGRDAPDDGEEAPLQLPEPAPEGVEIDTLPAWAHALLGRLRDAAATPASAAALRPALQAWRVGLPVLLASPAGLACLQASGDAAVWRWRRWPARWRSARPATAERWWAVRVGLGPQGRPQTLRELAGSAPAAPGQVSCELRLDDVAPGIARWTDVLVHAPASPSLRTLLAARPSMPWLLCNQPLWPQEV